MTDFLHVTDLSVQLSGRQIFTDVNFSITNSQFIGLLGPNGAGKTTLLRALLGLIPAQRGAVQVAGFTGAKVRDAVGYVPQRHEFAWDFPINVVDAVASGRTGLRRFPPRRGAKAQEAQEAVDQALAHVGLSDLRFRTIGQLSGGQRQRVLVARALSTRPKLLLLDEPFTGLDMPTAEQLSQLFITLAAQGTAIIMSTHDIAEALTHCHRLVLFNQGIRADAQPRDIAPEVWMDCFGIGAASPLLTLIGAHQHV